MMCCWWGRRRRAPRAASGFAHDLVEPGKLATLDLLLPGARDVGVEELVLADDSQAGRDVLGDDGLRADGGVVADADVAYDGAAGAQCDTVADLGMAVAALRPGPAERGAVEHGAVLSHDGGLADDDGGGVVHHEAAAQGPARRVWRGRTTDAVGDAPGWTSTSKTSATLFWTAAASSASPDVHSLCAQRCACTAWKPLKKRQHCR
mmetsp:Transcript_22732/g.71189  ORF Transcript_22732/g.71189 Transcript_22732/m.71189 type:complete len:206 (+) Transcript_22732:1461-2078(+)